MFRNIFGGKSEGDRGGNSGENGNSGSQEGQNRTIGDIFYDEAVKAADRGSQGFQPNPSANPPQANQLDSDVFLGEEPGPQQQRQSGQPHQPGQQQQSPQQGQSQQGQSQQGQQQNQPGSQVFIPQGYQTPAQLRSKYDRTKENRTRLANRLRNASEQDAGKNPYAMTGANGKVEFDQNRHNRDQLDYQSLNTEMQELMLQITDAERSTGDVTEQVRKAANQFFREQFAGRNASQEVVKATGTLFAAHVQQLIRSGFLLDANNLSGNALNSHFRNLFYASFGEASSAGGVGSGAKGAVRPMGQVDDDPDRQPEDPHADWPDESKRMMAAFEKGQSTKPRTVAEAARMEREKNNPPANQNGGNR